MTQSRFEQVAAIIDFPTREAELREFWKSKSIFEKSLSQRKTQERFVFYEGPPTANGMPHNGHALTRVMKDVFPRYKSMCGYYVPRIAGWDTHGLPVEIEVEKELRISGKDAIREYGVEPFVKRCIDSVFRYTNEWRSFSDKLAFWVDHEAAYVTYHEHYVESVWWALAELFKRDLLYQGHKVVWWWPQGGTALSSAEVGQGYKTVDDPSLYVKFPLHDFPKRSLVVWTTTPWTLPSNSFAAVKPSVEYAVVRDGEEELIVARELVGVLAEKLGRELPQVDTLLGELLLGAKYTPPFNWFSASHSHPSLWSVVAADFVELDAGTGIVHIAPAFGEADFDVLRGLQRETPELPLLCAVLPDGTFDPSLAAKAYAGRNVKQADRDLIRELKERGLALHVEQVRHEYPFCWRADNDPLIQYARPAWYVRTTDRIQAALENNQAIHWLPEHIQEGRFGDFLRNNVDWALSRERFWGTPLNIWVNDETGSMHAPASVAEIASLNPRAFESFEAAKAKDPELSPHLRVHKPWIDAATWQKPGEAGTYRRVSEVIDCWFDSGAMPFAQFGYPHRNSEKFEASYPADFICEAIDQTRGWFNSLLWISTLLFQDKPNPKPYRNCIVLGHVADREGKKESKSKGNYTPPETIIDRVRLEFAARQPQKEAPKAGEARIALADYEGLDLRGDQARLRIYRGQSEAEILELVVRPAKMPRRVIELAPVDLERLNLQALDSNVEVLPVEVPQLADAQKVWVEDGSAAAPGADAFRWFFFSSNPPWNSTRHSLSAVRSQQRELPLKLRNVYSFFTIYANIDAFDPADAELRKRRRSASKRHQLDRWILSELALTIRQTRQWMDEYRVYEASGVLNEFVDALSNWYVRRSRDRFWAPGLADDKLDAHWTLYECLVALAGLLAPFLPYAAEDIWQNLVVRSDPNACESVHLSDYPVEDESHIDLDLSRSMASLRELVSLGLQIRTANKLKVRQPLSALELVLADPQLEPTIAAQEDLILEELNVRSLRFVRQADEYVSFEVKPNFRALGPRVGKKMPLLKKQLAELDGAPLLAALESDGAITLSLDGESLVLNSDEIAVSLKAKEGFAAASGEHGVVVLHTTLTPELIQEGYFREIQNRVQNLRKELDLEYTTRISLGLRGDPELLDAARAYQERLAQETLAQEMHIGEAVNESLPWQELQIDGKPLEIGLLPLGVNPAKD